MFTQQTAQGDEPFAFPTKVYCTHFNACRFFVEEASSTDQYSSMFRVDSDAFESCRRQDVVGTTLAQAGKLLDLIIVCEAFI